METVYLDNAATTRLDSDVRRAMEPYLEDEFGNPSSRHPLGTRAAEALDRARGQVARALGARPERVVFTSGGTEANNLAIFGLARAAGGSAARRSGHVLVGPTEHASVRQAARALSEEGFTVETLRLTSDGALDLEDAERRLREDTVLLAQMLVQGEVGSNYPVAQLARLVRARAPRARVHVDAVQALGKLECSLPDLGAHSLSLSAHKLHGPKGTGALVLAEGTQMRPLFFGGGQEQALRPGTQNVAGTVGLGAAVELAAHALEATARHLRALRERFERGLAELPGARVLAPGGTAQGVMPGIVAVSFSGPPAEVRMHHLEACGVLVSAGAACHARKSEVNPTYQALGLSSEEARRVLRFSFSRCTSEAEVDRALAALRETSRALDPAAARRAQRAAP